MLILVVSILAGLYIFSLFQPVSGTPAETVTFVVPKGQAVSVIGNRLKQQNLIKQPLIFRFIVKQQNLENKIQAGSFQISPNMTPSEIASVLTKGTNDLWVTVVEGWRVEEIADLLDEQDLKEFDKEEFIILSEDDEGCLFPDTYLIPRLATSETIYNLLTTTFDKKVTVGLADEIENSQYSFDDIMIMASLVEREAKGYEQMRQVAGVLWNRIEIGMPLQVDATLQYANGYSPTQNSWWVPPTADDKTHASLFNTYTNPGLPPRPICSPGLDAIKATLNPLSSNDLYYIHDRQGKIHTSETLEEHNLNIETYLR